jgi:poly(glycerol-phosphate) alpha-glucosyltransferase
LKRLCILLPSITADGGGVTEVARLLTHAAYESSKYKITVCSFESDDFGVLNYKDNWPNVEFIFFKSYGPRNFRFSPRMIFFFLTHSFDIVHMHGIWMAHGIAAIFSQIKGIPVIISIHGMLEQWILNRSKYKKNLVNLIYQRNLLKYAALLIALTDKEVKDINNSTSNKRIEVLPNFVENNGFTEAPPRWFTPEMIEKDIYLFLGRINKKKGWSELLDAWSHLCDSNNAFASSSTLVFCGWVDEISNFEERLHLANARYKNVIFAGPQFGPHKRNSFIAADFFILPSQSEGFPMTILEAVASNCVILMSDECNIPDIHKNAAIDCGSNKEKIIDSLLIAYNMSNAERQSLCDIASTIVNEKFSQEVVFTEYVKILDNYTQ